MGDQKIRVLVAEFDNLWIFDALFDLAPIGILEMVAHPLYAVESGASETICMRLSEDILKKQDARFFCLFVQSESRLS